jgi:hypothetical protein
MGELDTGSYINGTWSQVASPPNCPNGYPGASGNTVYSPLYYASAVLPDGRFVIDSPQMNRIFRRAAAGHYRSKHGEWWYQRTRVVSSSGGATQNLIA